MSSECQEDPQGDDDVTEMSTEEDRERRAATQEGCDEEEPTWWSSLPTSESDTPCEPHVGSKRSLAHLNSTPLQKPEGHVALLSDREKALALAVLGNHIRSSGKSKGNSAAASVRHLLWPVSLGISAQVVVGRKCPGNASLFVDPSLLRYAHGFARHL